MSADNTIASIVMAAGRGSRMYGYDGNKSLLPLCPRESLFKGHFPMLLHILESLPDGPKALVVHHCREAVLAATRHLALSYCEQPVLNGTGGALLASRNFVDNTHCTKFVITMGDVPLVRKRTYDQLASGLKNHDFVVLGFYPTDKKRYGLVETKSGHVVKITEWKDWHLYPQVTQREMTICNAGIYAASKIVLEHYLPQMASRPQIVYKEINAQMTAVEEFFITDMVEFMVQDGLSVGCLLVDNELETMGVDDPEALAQAQRIYAEQHCPAVY